MAPLLGSKEGIFHLPMACVEPGDIVLVPDPAYPIYARGAHYAGGKVVFISLLKELELLPDIHGIPQDIARRARLLWLNYPNNPTAATATLEFFSAAVAFAKEYEILLCHDAAYTQVTYEGYRAPSLLQIPGAKEVAVEFNSLSKSHNMAGWRVGVVVGNRQALVELRKLKPNIDSGHFLPIMDAATIALTEDQAWLSERNEVYRERRDLVIRTVSSLGRQTLANDAFEVVVVVGEVHGRLANEAGNKLVSRLSVNLPRSTYQPHRRGARTSDGLVNDDA